MKRKNKIKRVRKINIARIIWVSGIFLILIIILLLVMNYKINYQYLTKNYIYFYECTDQLCVTRVEDKEKLLFSTYDCGYEECPEYKKNISDDYAILEDENKYILYNYKKSKVVSDTYEDYEFIDTQHIITKKGNLYGIIDTSGKEIIKPTYDEIGLHNNEYLSGYNMELIITKKNDKYGIISYKSGKIVEEFKYTNNDLNELITYIQKEIS